MRRLYQSEPVRAKPMQPDPVLEKYRRPQGRPVVTPAVMEVISRLAARRLEIPPRLDEAKRKKLELLASGRIIAGAGVDLEKSRLRQLRYAKIDIEKRNLAHRQTYHSLEHFNAVCIVGYTDNVYMEEIGRGNAVVAIWDMGPYEICVPIPDMPSGNIERFSFIHTDDIENDNNRHPHHYAGHTCWSGFADSVIGAMKDVEVAELMRTLRIFVGRYYNGSPLTRSWKGIKVATSNGGRLEEVARQVTLEEEEMPF